MRIFDVISLEGLSFKDAEGKEITKDTFLSAASEGKVKRLRTTIAATHAGRTTKNNMLYMPAKVRAGVASWTMPFPKPVLLHHNEESDPIGRVIGARYVDTSHLVPHGILGTFKFQNKTIKDFVDGDVSTKQTVAIVNELWKSGILADKSYKGLGYIEITTLISDLAAIEKILDGRFLTGSIGASTNSALCNIPECFTDWAASAEGPCNHRPGKEYEGIKCLLVAGDLEYGEYSHVNGPADDLSSIIGFSAAEAIMDSIQQEPTILDKVPLIILTDSENKEAPVPDTFKAILEDPDLEGKENVLKDLETLKAILAKPDTEALPCLVKEFPAVPEEQMKVLLEKVKPLPTVDDKATTLINEILEIEWNENLFDYDTNWDELEKEDAGFKDAKLSTAQRNKLSKSTFCGPGRSFPVPDLAHVTAARRLIGRAKVSSSTKARILACVNRKAKALGEKKRKSEDSMKTSEPTTPAPVQIPEPQKPSENEKQQIAVLTESLAKESEASKLLDSQNKELTTQLTCLRKELKATYSDNEQLQDQLIKLNLKLRDSRVQFATMATSLAEKTVKDAAYQADLSKKSLDELETTIKMVLDNVDIAKVVDKLVDNGLTNVNPTKPVEDPTLLAAKLKDKVEKDREAEIMKQHTRIFIEDGPQAAADYLKWMRVVKS